MLAVLPTWETEFHTSSLRLQREQQHTWSQRSAVTSFICVHWPFTCLMYSILKILMMWLIPFSVIPHVALGPDLCAGEHHSHRHAILSGTAAVEAPNENIWAHPGRDQGWKRPPQWVTRTDAHKINSVLQETITSQAQCQSCTVQSKQVPEVYNDSYNIMSFRGRPHAL